MKNLSKNGIIIKDSFIHGKGVFAGRDFQKGEIIFHRDTSHTLSDEQLKNISEEDKKYVCLFDGKRILIQEPERYVNHNCEANTYAENFCDIANRDIKKGEEITSDYSNQLDEDDYIECHCGSKNCKKSFTK